MTALVMTWHDTARKDFRALVDYIDADGDRHPGSAARGADAESLGTWITAIVRDLDCQVAKFIDLGEIDHSPSFLSIRAMALVKEAHEVTI